MKIILKTLLCLSFLLFNNSAIANDLQQGYLALKNKDYKTAIYFFSYFANLGYSKAQYNYAIMLKNGLGTRKNENEAFNWFFLSAKQNNMLANYALAHSYEKGIGTEKNLGLALDSYKKAALLGHASSKMNLGNIYFKGIGTKKSNSKAHFWWRLALDQNLIGAEKNVQMIENLMTNQEKLIANKMYFKCLKETLYRCLND